VTECIVLAASVARWFSPKSAKCYNTKLLDSAKSFVTSFQLKLLKAVTFCLKIGHFQHDQNKPIKLYNIQIFRLGFALSKHGLKMSVLANTLFAPQFFFQSTL